MTIDQRACANNRLMPAPERALIADRLKLALDEIETGLCDIAGLRNAVFLQREALRTSHRRLERLGEVL